MLKLQFSLEPLKKKSKSRAPALYLPFCVLWSKVMKRKLRKGHFFPPNRNLSRPEHKAPSHGVCKFTSGLCGLFTKKRKKEKNNNSEKHQNSDWGRPSSLTTEIIKAVPLTNIWSLNGYLFCRNTLAARLIHNLKVKISLEHFLRRCLISGGRQTKLPVHANWIDGSRIEPCDVTLTRRLSPLGQKDFQRPLWLLYKKLCVFKGAQNRHWRWPKQSVHINGGDLDCLKKWLFGAPQRVIA